MTMEQFSIILESISFLCVTLDLYGKERLEKLQSRLLDNLKNFQNKDLSLEYLVFLMKTPNSIIFIVVLLIIASFFWMEGIGIYENPYTWIFAGIGILIFIPLTFDKTINKIISFVLSMMNKHNLDGVLLGFGTILFFLSRLLLFFK